MYNEFVSTKRIIADIPFDNAEILSYRGIRSGNIILILHAEFNNLSFPFDSITYSHPDIMAVDREAGAGKTRSVGTEHPDEITLPDGSDTAKQGGTIFISEEPSKNFRFPPNKIEKIVSSVTKRKASSNVYVKKEALEYTMQGKTGTGRRISVDLLPEDTIEPVDRDEDFVEFCNAIGRIPYISKVASLDIEYGFFSGNTSFATMHGRGQRKYALAAIIFSSGDSLSIVEACNTDGWSLSTMRIRSSGDTQAFAMQMIDKLNTSEGHWDKDWYSHLAGATYLPLKHYNHRSADRWAELLVGQ